MPLRACLAVVLLLALTATPSAVAAPSLEDVVAFINGQDFVAAPTTAPLPSCRVPQVFAFVRPPPPPPARLTLSMDALDLTLAATPHAPALLAPDAFVCIGVTATPRSGGDGGRRVARPTCFSPRGAADWRVSVVGIESDAIYTFTVFTDAHPSRWLHGGTTTTALYTSLGLAEEEGAAAGAPGPACSRASVSALIVGRPAALSLLASPCVANVTGLVPRLSPPAASVACEVRRVEGRGGLTVDVAAAGTFARVCAVEFLAQGPIGSDIGWGLLSSDATCAPGAPAMSYQINDDGGARMLGVAVYSVDAAGAGASTLEVCFYVRPPPPATNSVPPPPPRGGLTDVQVALLRQFEPGGTRACRA
jgi:hypothetical protein